MAIGKVLASPDPRDEVFSGSFRMTADSVDGLLPADEITDGYDAYGTGFTVQRNGNDKYTVVLDDAARYIKCVFAQVSRAYGNLGTLLFPVVMHPVGADGKTVEIFIRAYDGSGVATASIEITDRLHILIVANKSGIDIHTGGYSS